MSPAAAVLRDPEQLERNLCQALLQPKTADEMARLLADLCTPAEVRTLAERWQVAQLLEGGSLSYREISEATGVSPTTVVRVARFLRQEPHQGYRMAMERLEAADVR